VIGVGHSAERAPACETCGTPWNAEHFDQFGFAPLPDPGKQVVLASFEAPPQHCAILECFSQYTDVNAGNPVEVRTPGIEWRLLVNGRPLYPYVDVQVILNPWGFGSFCVRLKLSEAARLELAVRRRSDAGASAINVVGGRLSGRYWFNRE